MTIDTREPPRHSTTICKLLQYFPGANLASTLSISLVGKYKMLPCIRVPAIAQVMLKRCRGFYLALASLPTAVVRGPTPTAGLPKRKNGYFLARAAAAVLSAAAISALGSSPAAATATVSVRAFWSTSYFDYSSDGVSNSGLPDGITITCIGGASAAGANGCSDQRILSAQNPSDVVQNFSTTAVSGFALTNTTQNTFSGSFDFFVDFSAFNPGGPEIGAEVDDPSQEYALFSSQVYGPGAGDSHACDTRNYPGPNNFSPFACGVQSPDSSSQQFFLGPLGPGETLDAYYQISITAQLKGDVVPEPGTFPLFVAGLSGLLLLFWRRTRTPVPA